MNLNLNIDNYGGKSVVPVKCREVQGTAFYIGNGYLLTAYHVVSDAEYDRSSIIVTIDGKDVLCELMKIGDIMDVALLRCLEPIDENLIEKIPLLNTEFKKGLDLEIIGYPQEIGNGIDYFGVSVRNVRNLSNHTLGFDIVVQRTDAFGFYSYSGFSGSPVLNEFGYAIGVVTDQLHRSLGYTSINSIVQALPKEVNVENNADEFDSRPYGIGTCIKATEESLKKMSSRYREDLHSEDLELEKNIRLFCGLDIKEEQEELRIKYCNWYDTLPENYKEFCKAHSAFIHYLSTGERNKDFYLDLERIGSCRDPRYHEDYFIRGYYHNVLQDLMDELQDVQDKEMLSKRRLLYITGDAGYGKTHHLCHITNKLCKEVNIYLFFGTEFSTMEDPLRTIATIRRWEDVDYMKVLNNEVAKKGKYAIFIIDALNEGEGTFYWKEKLPQIVETFRTYQNIKLIVSVRTMESDDELHTILNASDWEKLDLGGFSNTKAALQKYFKVYGIYEDPEIYSNCKEFTNPLLLKIFCESFYLLPIDKRKEIDILLLYNLYFRKCNKNVSRWTDEDPQRDVTTTLMYSIGRRSLEKYHCCDIPRRIAIRIANKICRNRLWSNNLYHSAVKENLLMEYGTIDGYQFTTFQYDNMGDYVRATNLFVQDKTDEERFEHIKRLLGYCAQGTMTQKEKVKTLNTVTAFLSVWNPDEKLWNKPDFKGGLMRACLIRSLSTRNLASDKNTLHPEFVQNILKEDENLLNVIRVFEQFNLYKTLLMPYLHDRLMTMSMLERDEKWTIGVNGLLDSYRLSYTINSVSLKTAEDIKIYVWLLCWMFTSSHPNLRIRMIRVVRSLMSKQPLLCKDIIDVFYLVNDPYVLSGVYAAIYGVLLTNRDGQLTHNVAERIYKYHYENQVKIPSDIDGRIWTLKILEYNNHINPEDDFWNNSQPPYKPAEDLITYPTTETFGDDYFGPEGGAYCLRHSLFAWDFNRYIIGTNSNNESKTFIFNDRKILLDDITKAVAYRIKHVYGYSEILSEYDKSVEWGDRHYHLKERIGKKYQWIALGEVKAYLCDICKMTKNRFTEELAEIPYPWYADRSFYFDPTLKVVENQIVLDNEMFDYLPSENLFGITDGREWLDSREVLPSLNIILRDRNQCEWVVIVGYQKYTQEKDGEKRESFIYYAPCLVKDTDDCANKFESWAKEQDFYGRWMPESTGNYEFIWNEYPWADTFKQIKNDEVEIWGHKAPCNIKLPYSAQLQEDRVAIDDEDDIKSTVYMPLSEFYEMFGLYNAERGVVRNNDGYIIALNRNIPGDAFDGLVIRRDYLNKFLAEEGYSLFFCNLGEKQLWSDTNLIDMQRLSSCCKYMHVGEVEVIQPMKDERDFHPSSSKEENKIFSGINIEDWLSLENDDSAKYLIEKLKNN